MKVKPSFLGALYSTAGAYEHCWSYAAPILYNLGTFVYDFAVGSQQVASEYKARGELGAGTLT